jgi:hypothetical protein
MGRLVILLDHRACSLALKEVNDGQPFIEVVVPLSAGHAEVLLIEQPRILDIPLPRELTVSGGDGAVTPQIAKNLRTVDLGRLRFWHVIMMAEPDPLPPGQAVTEPSLHPLS